MTPAADIDAITAAAAADADMDIDAARAALAGALGLLDRHGDRDAMAALYARIEGAEALAASAEARPRRGGGLFGGMMRSAGGVSGKALADAMGVLDGLKAHGVDKDDLKRLLPAARERVRAAVGHDLLGDAVRSVPGMGALLGA